MERARGYRDEDIEIDLNDDKKQQTQKILDDTRAERDILLKHIKDYQKREDNIKFRDVLKDDRRYQELKKQNNDLLKEEHMKKNLEQIKEAREITDRAKELEKFKRARDMTKDLDRDR